MIHCWQTNREDAAEQYGEYSPQHIDAILAPSASCLLSDGHAGPHLFTPDADSVVMFAPEETGS